eukprot:SAG31_NODE_1741_length_7387_cov_6.330132_2_plen_39_part_00
MMVAVAILNTVPALMFVPLLTLWQDIGLSRFPLSVLDE